MVRSTNTVIAARSVTSTGSVTRRSRWAGATRARSSARSVSTAYGTATIAPSARNRSVTAWPSAPVPPVTIATRFCSGGRGAGAFGGWPETRGDAASSGMSLFIPQGRSLARGDRHDRRALDLVVTDPGDVERLEVRAELLEGLLEGRQRFARPGERRGAGQHVVLHVRVVDAALLDLRHDLAQGRVRLADERGALPALLEALRQRELQELVHPPQDRRERPTRESLVLFVEEAERDEVGGLELRLPALLGARGLVLRERPVHPDDLERFLLQVVRLLDVERSEEHTSELQSRLHLVCRLLLEKKKNHAQDKQMGESNDRLLTESARRPIVPVSISKQISPAAHSLRMESETFRPGMDLLMDRDG